MGRDYVDDINTCDIDHIRSDDEPYFVAPMVRDDTDMTGLEELAPFLRAPTNLVMDTTQSDRRFTWLPGEKWATLRRGDDGLDRQGVSGRTNMEWIAVQANQKQTKPSLVKGPSAVLRNPIVAVTLLRGARCCPDIVVENAPSWMTRW